MKKFLIVLFILAAICAGIWLAFFRSKKSTDTAPRQQPLTVSKLSDTFNISAGKMLSDYYSLSEAFVVWDTLAVGKLSLQLKTSLDSLRVDQLKKDELIFQTASSAWGNAKVEIDGLIKDGSLEEKRLALNSLTQFIYDLLRTARYDQSKIYFQECPMAFGENQPGNWLSKTSEVRNPYLGTQHPKYRESMLTCGGPKDTLNFMLTGTTKQ